MIDDDERELDDVRRLVRTRGVRVAANALIAVCEDGKAPAPARSTAGTSLFRAAGMFDKTESEDQKSPAEMTGEEIRRRIEQLQANAATAESRARYWAEPNDDDDEEKEDDRGALFE